MKELAPEGIHILGPLHTLQVFPVLLFGRFKVIKEWLLQDLGLRRDHRDILGSLGAYELATPSFTVRSSSQKTRFGFEKKDGMTYLFVRESYGPLENPISFPRESESNLAEVAQDPFRRRRCGVEESYGPLENYPGTACAIIHLQTIPVPRLCLSVHIVPLPLNDRIMRMHKPVPRPETAHLSVHPSVSEKNTFVACPCVPSD
jgi:hypothetical protein